MGKRSLVRGRQRERAHEKNREWTAVGKGFEGGGEGGGEGDRKREDIQIYGNARPLGAGLSISSLLLAVTAVINITPVIVIFV